MADEKHADIIAEMRRCKDIVLKHRNFANRLEAAHEREVQDALDTGGYVEASRRAKQSGDAAKLREALQSCLDTICRIVWIDDPVYDKDGHYLGANYAAVSRDKARAALAAPPRNCDVYNNESCRMAYHLYGDGLMTMQAFADWLFAPAKEQEGGAK